mmetsp:Transcript_8771/g.19290  ORF Transcript_8771/g.19290 Transcript_8771/m.19290 type:complete len:140 (-) Transcript_8771:1225-1644(-)
MQREYESQKTEDTMTQAEIEEMEVRKRRAEGTPCTDETFEKWANSFNAEKETEDESRNNNATTEKLNGRELFLQGLAKGRGIGKSAAGLEAAVASAGSVKKNAVAAAENADEDLFDDGDSDLDDLDFDDDFDDDDSTNS